MKKRVTNSQVSTLDYSRTRRSIGPRAVLRRVYRWGALSLLMFGVWTAIVRYQAIQELCPMCYHNGIVEEYSVAGIVIFRHPLPTVESRYKSYAEALGRPCPHTGYVRYVIEREWGLWLHQYCNGPGSYLEPDSEADAAELRIVKSLANSDPQLPASFYHRVLENHDVDYFFTIRGRVDAIMDGEQHGTVDVTSQHATSRASDD